MANWSSAANLQEDDAFLSDAHLTRGPMPLCTVHCQLSGIRALVTCELAEHVLQSKVQCPGLHRDCRLPCLGAEWKRPVPGARFGNLQRQTHHSEVKLHDTVEHW